MKNTKWVFYLEAQLNFISNYSPWSYVLTILDSFSIFSNFAKDQSLYLLQPIYKLLHIYTFTF